MTRLRMRRVFALFRMGKVMHTVGDWESSHLDHAAKWFLLARAYLDSSLRLCKDMVDGSYPRTFEHGKVAMSLCVHSVELFYKAVIWKATGSAPNSHNLAVLEQNVRRVAPDVADFFACPFIAEEVQINLDSRQAAQIAELKAKVAKTLDQKMRYHVDNDGNPWAGPNGFMPELFLATLQHCATQYDIVICSLSPELAGQ